MKKVSFILVFCLLIFLSGNLVFAQNDMNPLDDGFESGSSSSSTSTASEGTSIDSDENLEGGLVYDDIVEDDEDGIQYYKADVVEDDEYETDYDAGSPSFSYHGLPSITLSSVLSGILNWILGILGTLALISFAISGIMYLTAAGNENMAEKAKKGITYSIIGVIVALSGYIIIKAINSILQGGTMF